MKARLVRLFLTHDDARPLVREYADCTVQFEQGWGNALAVNGVEVLSTYDDGPMWIEPGRLMVSGVLMDGSINPASILAAMQAGDHAEAEVYDLTSEHNLP